MRFDNPGTLNNMVLEIGPCDAQEMLNWTKFARRIACELRTSSAAHSEPQFCGESGLTGESSLPGGLSTEMISQWAQLIESWQAQAQSSAAEGQPFRWTSDLEPAMAEFLLDGLNRCVRSPQIGTWCSLEEMQMHLPITKFVLWAFVTALETESGSCQHYTDQIRMSLAGVLADN